MTKRNSRPALNPTRALVDTRMDGPAPVVSSELACVVFLAGERVGYKLPLQPGRLEIGRDPACDISLSSDLVSRNHARLLISADKVLLVDLSSTNGTFVNDRRIRDWLLVDGDRIGIGNVWLKYLGPGNAESSYHDEVFRLVTHDGLTEVFNRRYYDDELAKHVSAGHAVGLLIFDADHFKSINDVHGHAGGDRVLREVTKRIVPLLPSAAFLARIGGEEFAIVAWSNDLDELVIQCRDLGERVRAAVADEPVAFAERSIPVSVSVGVAWTAPIDAQTSSDRVTTLISELVAEADQRLYSAKQSGRNRVCNS
jgi:two-component system, cell cycle response regulator